ncbi:MAG: aldo/keto reductase [Sphaerochaetaceae bacterium]|nr:aldo/keto reductase [Sphaerochaetaceae bacterium]
MNMKLKDGSNFPNFGLGTWFLGENPLTRAEEIKAIRTGIEMGVNLIDTAEMYGNGLSESLIGEAIRQTGRDSLYLVSKVLPENAGSTRLEKSLDATLRRLGTDHLDMYLYHWRGSYPLEETVGRLQQMVDKGKILRWGVSNFDTDDMEELLEIPEGRECCVNQVLYHLGSRGIEYDLLPLLRDEGIKVMAYCPLAQGGSLRSKLLSSSVVKEVAQKNGVSVFQLLLMFVLHMDGVCAIPRSGRSSHVKELVEASRMELSEEDYRKISEAFPAPNHKTYLDVV